MVILFALLCCGLLCAAWINRHDRGMAIFFLACALLNAGAGVHMVATQDPDALGLRPDSRNDPQENALPDRR